MAVTFNQLLNDAIVEIANADENYRVMNRRYQEASKAECAARNRLNNSQKAFDELVASLKKQAPRGSDWKHTLREQD